MSRILVFRAHSFVFLLLVFAVRVVAFPLHPSRSTPLSPFHSSYLFLSAIFESPSPSRVYLLSVRPLNLEHSVSVLSSRCEVRGYVCKAQYVFLSFNAIGDLEFRLICSLRLCYLFDSFFRSSCVVSTFGFHSRRAVLVLMENID